MEENIDEIFDTNRTGKNVKHAKPKNNKNKKVILIIALIVLLLSVAVLVIKILLKDREPVSKENLVYSEFNPLISKLNDETYYIFGAKKDISFKITKQDKFSYQILDEEGTEIKTEIENDKDNSIIKAPEELYTPGKTYTLKIENGLFTDDELKSAKKIIFNITRPSANKYELKENVIVIDNANIENNKLKTQEVYKENDIIAIRQDGKIINSFKINKVNSDGTYDLTNPKTDEVFESIDYYGMEKINLSSFETNKELNAYLINKIQNQLVKYLADTVYAKENIEIKKPKWDKKTNQLKLSVIIDAPENTKLFENSILKQHKSDIEIFVAVSANLYKDVTLDKYDYAISMEYTFNNKVTLTSTNDKIVELNDNVRNNKTDYDATWLNEEYTKIENDKMDINKSFGKNIVYTEIPGLNIAFDFNFIINSDIKTILDGNMAGKMTTSAGINSNKDIYGNIIMTSQGNITSIGDGNTSIGYAAKTTLSYLDNLKLEANIIPVMHIESKSDIKDDSDKENIKITYEVKSNNVFNNSYNLDGIVNGDKVSKKIYDNKQELKTYEKKAEFTKKKEKKEEEFKYTAEEVRQKITEAYNELNSKGEWVINGGSIIMAFKSNKTIDVDNNKLIATWTYDGSATYTCSYDYLNKNMKCNNFKETQDYIKNACNAFHDDYLNYQETGEIDNEDAAEWENLYDSLESCYYEIILETEPKNYNEDFTKILDKAELTEKDLGVLKKTEE